MQKPAQLPTRQTAIPACWYSRVMRDDVTAPHRAPAQSCWQGVFLRSVVLSLLLELRCFPRLVHVRWEPGRSQIDSMVHESVGEKELFSGLGNRRLKYTTASAILAQSRKQRLPWHGKAIVITWAKEGKVAMGRRHRCLPYYFASPGPLFLEEGVIHTTSEPKVKELPMTPIALSCDVRSCG